VAVTDGVGIGVTVGPGVGVLVGEDVGVGVGTDEEVKVTLGLWLLTSVTVKLLVVSWMVKVSIPAF
jgi:hypothetical protein